MKSIWEFLLAWSVLPILLAEADTLVRGPYLQLPSQSSMTVRWRTDTSHIGSVFFGTSATNMIQSAQESSGTTKHKVKLSGLLPDTTYYYAIHSESDLLAGDESYHFRTFPANNSTGPFRAWVLGDPGTGSTDAPSVYSAYMGYTGTNRTDLIFTLGDNAYYTGSDVEFQSFFFEIYPEILRTTPVFPSIGNHDGMSSTSSTQTGPYFDIFSLPPAGECGGVASSTEAYYSYEHGNAHFICLDSYGSDRTTNGAMYAWLEQDLTACDATWIIAYWHHAPYSLGSHDSDDEDEMTEMRENILPLLEEHGTDLVLTGHSHTYERTYLMDGHYGNSASYDFDVHALNQGNGKESGDGIYVKPAATKPAHRGTVYVVAGTSGYASSSLMGDHPAMENAILQMGSVVLDIADNRLDLVFLNKDGVIADSFSIAKGADDFDGDGMSDLWEQDNFRISVAPDGYADTDSMNNLDEYIAGTDPNDASSYFNITTNYMDPAGFILHWTSATNRSYDVQWASSVTNPMVNIETNLLSPQCAYTDTLHTAHEAGFYRVEVRIAE